MNNEVYPGLQLTDQQLLEKLYNKYKGDIDLIRLLELQYMEKEYRQDEVKVDGLLYLIRSLKITKERG